MTVEPDPDTHDTSPPSPAPALEDWPRPRWTVRVPAPEERAPAPPMHRLEKVLNPRPRPAVIRGRRGAGEGRDADGDRTRGRSPRAEAPAVTVLPAPDGAAATDGAVRVDDAEIPALQTELLLRAADIIQRLRPLSETDHLTGLLNRRAIADRLEVEVRRAERHERNLALLLVDIDNLRAVNEVKGHIAGDEVLRRVSRRLVAATRLTDHLGRWGGDEFLFVCPETDASGAVVVAAKLVRAVRRITVEIGGAPVPMSVSVGVVPVSFVMTSDDAVMAADSALHRAKQGGGNCWSI